VSLIPILVAMDAPGVLPLFVGHDRGDEAARAADRGAPVHPDAFLVTLGFVLVGRWIFDASASWSGTS